MDLADAVRDLFAEEMAGKFLATIDPGGKVNVALIVTLQPPPDGRKDRLIFGEFLMWKSRENLERDGRVAAAVVSTKLKAATLTGDFRGFERSGPYKEAIDGSSFMRYNAYSGVRSAGIVDVREAGPVRSFIPGAAVDMVRVRLRRLGNREGGVEIPSLVKEKFTKLTSIKALAVMGEDGYPRVYPLLAVSMAGDGAFVLSSSPYRRELSGLKTPCPAALCLVTMDAKSYKVKGELSLLGGGAYLLRVDEVFNAMPPLAGDLIVAAASENP
jgi:hypothetical protein